MGDPFNSSFINETIHNATRIITQGGKKPKEFDYSAWLVAIFCVVTVLFLRAYVKRVAAEKLEINIMDELKQHNAYKREDYDADTTNGALQKCTKDEND